MKSYILHLLIVPLLAAALGCAETPGESLTPVQREGEPTVQVAVQPLPGYIVVNGRVTAKREVEVATRMMARITTVSVDVGDRVDEGAVLIRLGSEEIEANRVSAQAAVKAATLAAEEARRQAERMDTLLSVDAVPTVQRDRAHLQRVAAESQLAMATSGLRNVEAAASYSTIRAPFEGTVVSRFVDPGDLAAPGMPLLFIQDTSSREGHIAIPASARQHIADGTTIEVSIAGFEPIAAEVTSVSTGVDPMTGTVEVVVDLPNDWVPGVTLTARVPTGMREGIAVPESSVVRRGQLTGVRVAGPEGTATRWVRLGRRFSVPDLDSPHVEILSGLEAGERIVL